MNLYELLDVARDATPEQIKSAYKKASNKHHPDKPGGDPEMFKQMKDAYNVLKDPEQRELYDRTGTVNKNKIDFHQAGMAKILMHVQNWYSKGNLDIDPIDMIKSELANELNFTRQKLNQATISREFVERARKRMSSKKDNFIVIFFDNKIKEIENLEANTEIEKLVVEKANQMIEDFTWEEAEQMFQGISFNSGPTTGNVWR